MPASQSEDLAELFSLWQADARHLERLLDSSAKLLNAIIGRKLTDSVCPGGRARRSGGRVEGGSSQERTVARTLVASSRATQAVRLLQQRLEHSAGVIACGVLCAIRHCLRQSIRKLLRLPEVASGNGMSRLWRAQAKPYLHECIPIRRRVNESEVAGPAITRIKPCPTTPVNT